jgi:hypothetical protein
MFLLLWHRHLNKQTGMPGMPVLHKIKQSCPSIKNNRNTLLATAIGFLPPSLTGFHLALFSEGRKEFVAELRRHPLINPIFPGHPG